MKYSFYPNSSLKSIPVDAEKIHLVRPVKFKLLSRLLEGRNVREVSMSPSCLSRMSGKCLGLLKKKGVEIKTGNESGRALSLGLEKIVKISELKGDYLSLRKIESITSVPKSTIHYLLKYSRRDKVRKGGQTIYMG